MNNNSGKDNILLGAMLYMAGYLFFAIMSALTKYLQEASGFSTIEITFFSYIYLFFSEIDKPVILDVFCS